MYMVSNIKKAKKTLRILSIAKHHYKFNTFIKLKNIDGRRIKTILVLSTKICAKKANIFN